MEVGRFGPRARVSMSRAWIRCVAFALTLGVLWSLPQAAAQSGSSAEFSARVLDLSKNYQQLTIPLNRSVTVETTIGISRADVVAPTIANVQIISPTRMLVTGQSFGNTSVVLTGADGKQYVFEAFVELDLEPLNRSIRSIDPLSTAKAESIQGNIVLTGSVSGTDSLCTVWEDPAFDPSERAFYYARVFETLTCRWSQRLCNDLGVDCSDLPSVPAEYIECCNADRPKSIQERAWTSANFYRPDGIAAYKAVLEDAKSAGEDSLELEITLGEVPAAFDLTSNDLGRRDA